MPPTGEEFQGNNPNVSGSRGEVKPPDPSGSGLPPDASWIGLFDRYRIAFLGSEEAIYGALRPGFHPGHPAVRDAIDAWPGRWHHTREDGEEGGRRYLVLARRVERETPTRWGLHFLLLAVTAFTTLAAGALLQGVDPLGAVPWSVGPFRIPVPTTVRWGELVSGLPFAGTLMGILLAHELGHYLAARAHRMRVSPPYFLPFPPYFSVVGTLGAFIRLRSPPVTRSTLLDVGLAGPLASLVLSIPALLWGLARSEVASGYADALTPYVIRFAGAPIWIGDSLLVDLLARFHVAGALGSDPVVLDPVAFAGWVGLFVTALNLLPFGQLDGGHILYAFRGEQQRTVARLVMVALVPLGFLWAGWWFWMALVLVLGRGRTAHPPTLLVPGTPGRLRTALTWIAIAAFLLTFVPAPVRI